MESGTTSLRSAAAQWSLDGDTKLLVLLKNIHEKVVHKCKETNSMFDQMITSLDEANIEVQTVNNRFMSLSNNQFVESRVYGDDTDLQTEAPAANQSKPAPAPSESSLVRSSLQQLEDHHDVLEIFPDTDSESDDECLTSVVLKPKNVYSDRPLPYIIGTANWRNKWHSGTIPSASESSSIRSRSQASQYSESGSEPGTQPANWPHDDTLSSRSISPAPRPAQIASELARRLGNIAQPPQPSPVYEQPKMDTTKIYKPEAPITATIFSDEPPPLPQISDTESDQFEEENDIFAELHKTNKRGGSEIGGGLIRNEVKNISNPPANQKSTLLQEESEPELFTPKPQADMTDHMVENAVKKPIGGISLFGSNKGTESIGAAILQRHQRKSSSDDESVSDNIAVVKDKPKTDNKVKNKPNVAVIKDKTKNDNKIENKEVKKQERDLFEDLFAKTKAKNKNEPKKVKEVEKTEVTKRDLFKDDIFDDIDDIFSSNVVSLPKKETIKQKSIFDDDDQLFSDIAITKTVPNETPSQSVASKDKGLFDSDDELFSDKIDVSANKKEDVTVSATSPAKHVVSATSVTKTNVIKDDLPKKISIFDDSDDDDMFSTVETKKPATLVDTSKKSIKINKTSPETNTEPAVSQLNTESYIETESKLTPKSNIESSNDLRTNNDNQVKPNVSNIEREVKHVPFQSPSMFDDDDEDIFMNSNKLDINNVENNDNKNQSNNTVLENNDNKSIHKEKTIEQESEVVEDNDLFTDDNIETDDKITANNSNYESDIDKYYSNTHTQEEIEEPIEDLAKDNQIDHSLDNDIGNKDTKAIDPTDIHDIDVSDLQTIVEQEKKKLDLEKSLEESLFKHNELNKQEVIEIFADEPPAFEIPKEPKKSKNVNALFDDDSDDEALFFKKEEPVVDDKPELFETQTKPSIFGIFQDEPPDFDFTQKEEKVTKIIDTKSVEDALNIVPKESQSDTDILNEAKADTKKIGKLKINLNINVNTLLPGASPKKTSKPNNENTNTQTDISANEQPASNSNEILDVKPESNDIDTTETDGQTVSAEALPKSVSFDNNPESSVLDNQLSKQRAKIQVKRRPSSRRARHEAVRKSIRINQDESNDSTDNSSSIDDHRSKSENNDDKTNQNEVDAHKTESHQIDDHPKQDELDNVSPKSEVEVISIIRKIPNEETTSVSKSDAVKDESVLKSTKDPQVVNQTVVRETKQRNVVYILNDEDIFNTTDSKLTESKKPDEQLKQNEQKPKILTIVDDDNNDNQLFKADKPIDTKITTNKSKKPPKTSLFDDSSDDEALFKPKTQNKKPITIFGSDSDEDLFFGKKTETKTSKGVRKKETAVKKSLFSDDEDDDLFGAKKKTAPKPSQAVPSTSTTHNPPTTVDDPLSNLEDDYTF